MEEDEKTDLPADARDEGTPSGAGKEDASDSDNGQDLILAKLNELSGREFSDMDDFSKHYSNLKSLVGDQEAAKARKEREKEEPEVADDYKERFERLEERTSKKEFLDANPDAASVVDLVWKEARDAGKTMEEAFDGTLRELAEAKAAYDRERSEKVTVESKDRIVPKDAKEIEALTESIGKNDSPDDKERLVSKVLGI